MAAIKVKQLGDVVVMLVRREIDVDVDMPWWKEIDYGVMKAVVVWL